MKIELVQEYMDKSNANRTICLDLFADAQSNCPTGDVAENYNTRHDPMPDASDASSFI